MGDPENEAIEMTPEANGPTAPGSAPEELPAEVTPQPEAEGEPRPAAAPPGVFYGTGRRKTSVARVYVWPGHGQVRVNGRKLEEYFLGPHVREEVREPLRFLGCADQYDAEITVRGGGAGGQAGAVRLGLARALAAASPEDRAKLRRNGFLTRNPRMKERKKYGQKGARKRFQWTKR